MGRIKSALEIALEKTENVKSDKATIGLFEAKQRGKLLANQFLAGEISSLEAEFKKAPAEEQGSLKQGCFEVFLSQINLPSAGDDFKRLETLGNGLSVIISTKHFAHLYSQFLGAVSQFLKEAAQYDDAIKRQYAPRLHQKEEEIAKRIGRQVKIDPFQDPEFVTFYNQHMNALKSNYENLTGDVRNQITEMYRPEC